jgi:FkbM family methyltransferase
MPTPGAIGLQGAAGSSIRALKRTALAVIPARVAGRLRAAHARLVTALYRGRLATHRYGSDTLAIYLTDPIAESWYDHDWDEPREMRWLRRGKLRRGARVFNLGAHHGVVAMLLAREVGPAGQVVAVEANRHNAAAAVRNSSLNYFENILVLHAAVSNHPGPLRFNARLNGQIDVAGDASGGVIVGGVTVDSLARDLGRPDVLFIDVEGAECRALEGASDVLATGPDVYVEAHAGCGLEKLGGSVRRLLSFFPPDRYDLLARVDGETEFRTFAPYDPLTKQRFHLLALAHA